MLVILPTALEPSGVVTWAIRLVSALAEGGRNAGLLLHGLAEGALAEGIHTGVRVFERDELPHFDELAGDLSGVIPAYADAVQEMCASGSPVVVSPNLHADCYGAVAGLTQTMPERVRTIGWAHSDNRYDECVLAHYEPMLHAMVGVSGVIRDGLAKAMPARGDDIARIAYGVPIDGAPSENADDRKLRLVYTGRVEDGQKRASVLVHLSRALDGLGIAHELRVVGDGPMKTELEREEAPSVRWLGTLSARSVREQLRWSDALVLPSRYEGLSVSMLEAMACGCAPIVTRVRSGAGEAIEHGKTGLLVEADTDDDGATVGKLMAEAIAGTSRDALIGLGREAQRVAETRYAIEGHVERARALIDRVVGMPARSWPATRPVAFQSGHAGSGSTPADAPSRLRDALRSLKGERVALHGTGRHTRDLASVLASEDGACVVALCDDDPGAHGTKLWNWPVVAPSVVRQHGIGAVVISTHMHEEAVWERRGVYESQGVRVVRLYA